MNPNTSKDRRRTIGILGGSFDPIHAGHLALAQHAHQHLPLDELWLMPVGHPRHRKALIAPYATRLSWVEAAVAALQTKAIKASAADAPRADGTVNATVKVLRSLNALLPEVSWVWLMGADAYQRFDQWLDWQTIPTLAHVVVCTRPPHLITHTEQSPALQTLWQQSPHDPCLMTQALSGVMTTLSFPALPFSSSAIRAQLKGRTLSANNDDAATLGLPSAVVQQLCQYNPYL